MLPIIIHNSKFIRNFSPLIQFPPVFAISSNWKGWNTAWICSNPHFITIFINLNIFGSNILQSRRSCISHTVQVNGRGSLKHLLKRCSAIEPVIGHSKQDDSLKRNYLRGKAGDRINALLAGCGFNLRKLFRFFMTAPLIQANTWTPVLQGRRTR